MHSYSINYPRLSKTTRIVATARATKDAPISKLAERSVLWLVFVLGELEVPGEVPRSS